ncbi:MAG: pyridoxal phosphate-dependent aminotransferase [Oscillospiraceae bacterium]|nr:pyridoxal phosphate-dependent aminotransferase [Oscillospiraceae bacterium]
MINQEYLNMLSNKNIIRILSEYATGRGKEIGYENVFDFSLGNPSVPAPQSFTDVSIDLLKTKSPMALHGYSPTLGIPEVKAKVAASLNRRFGMEYTGNHIFPTSGAAGAIAHAIRAVTKPGDEVLVFAPYFPEYNPYINGAGARIKVVPADFENFQINFDAAEEALTENVAAVLINSPNNPSGVLYGEETLEKLAALLTRKSEQFGHNVFLISDEPYREIVFDGKEAPYVAKYYPHTLTCYSFSKSLSVPGERIGYVAVNPACEHAEELVPMMGQISRGIGHNCPSSLIMLAMAETCDDTADLSVYETNMNLLYDTFKELGFTVVRPGGTFYIMPKALEEDSVAFCKKALKYDIVFVPADNFGAPGYFRVAYCLDTDKVQRSLPRIREFVEGEYGCR